MPKEETFPIPLKYIDVKRSSHTNLDALQENRIDDYWNVDANRSLSESWTGLTKFTLVKEKPPRGYMLSVVRLTKIQATTRPEIVWLEVWTKIWKSRSEERKARVGNGETKTRQRSKVVKNFFVGLEDREYSEILKNARRKKERHPSIAKANAKPKTGNVKVVETT